MEQKISRWEWYWEALSAKVPLILDYDKPSVSTLVEGKILTFLSRAPNWIGLPVTKMRELGLE